MIRIDELQDKLLHLVGWEQNFNTSDFKIADSLTKSESGLYFQQAHPLITLQNLACIAPDFKNIEYPEYDSTQDYAKGNVVQANNKYYKALDYTIGEPTTNTEYWQEVDPFSEWLESKTKGSIQKAIMRYLNEKMASSAHKTVCENKALFDGSGRIVDTIKNKRNFVGFELTPVRAKGVTTKINKIGLQFTKPGDYTLYLMHSSQQEPVKIINITKKTANSFEWFTVDDICLPYQSENSDSGGSWYLGYFQSDIPEGSLAIRKERDWAKGPCTSCSRAEYTSWRVWSKYLEVHPFYMPEEAINVEIREGEKIPKLWDIELNTYDYTTNFGLNLDITIGCDYTSFIVEQRALFQDIILKQLAVDMLREFMYNANARTNRHSINASKLDIQLALDGDTSAVNRSGLNYELELAIKAISVSTAGLDRVCQPCMNGGIRYMTV